MKNMISLVLALFFVGSLTAGLKKECVTRANRCAIARKAGLLGQGSWFAGCGGSLKI